MFFSFWKRRPITTKDKKNKNKNSNLLTKSAEIQIILEDIIRTRSWINVICPNKKYSMLTQLLVAKQEKYLYLDINNNAALNKAILKCATLHLVTQHKNIQVDFTVLAAKAAFYGQQPVLKLVYPNALHRLQRREYFRWHIPKETPLICTLHGNFSVTRTQATLTAHVQDISQGGISLIDIQHLNLFRVGNTLTCHLKLPDQAPLPRFKIQVISTHLIHANYRHGYTCAGCQFINVDNKFKTQIQHFINQQQRTIQRQKRQDSL